MNEGTPSGLEYNKPMAVVLTGPTAELYLPLKQEIFGIPFIGFFELAEI
jgi:hypothetical protein